MANFKIVIADADTVFDKDITPDIFEKFGELEVWGLSSHEEIMERAKDADAILCNKTVIDREVIDAAPKLKYIGLFATGFNNIDIDYAASRGIAVCNAPGYSTESVAQHTFALLLALLDRVGEYNRTVLEGDWIKSRTFSYFPLPLSELCGKTMGIVGYGAIGRRVGEIAMAFGMKVLVHNRRKVNDDRVEQVTFEELLSRADVVSMHCPLNEDSKGIMNADAFAKMKKGAAFINTARGGLVDEIALRDALESEHLMGAGVDVLCVEPMTADCPLYKAKNCFITPHIAWAGVETRRRLMGIVAQNIEDFKNGRPNNKVN